MRRKTTIGLVLAGGALLIPTGAQAATETYAGTTEKGGDIAFDVKVNGKSEVKKILEARGVNLPTACEQSGLVPSHLAFPDPIKVSGKSKFSDDYKQPTYGNVSTIEGKFEGRKVTGIVDIDFHFPAEDGYPAEDCSTGPIDFKAKLGADDVTEERVSW